MSNSAKKVAKFIIWWHQDRASMVTHVKLQKLLYYVQGFNLLVLKEPLFPEDFQAWQHGPVIPDIYNDYKAYGPNSLKTFCAISLSSKDEERVVKSILEHFEKYSAFTLAEQSHKEAPWRKHAPDGSVISQIEIQDFFNQVSSIGASSISTELLNYYHPFIYAKREA